MAKKAINTEAPPKFSLSYNRGVHFIHALPQGPGTSHSLVARVFETKKGVYVVVTKDGDKLAEVKDPNEAIAAYIKATSKAES